MRLTSILSMFDRRTIVSIIKHPMQLLRLTFTQGSTGFIFGIFMHHLMVHPYKIPGVVHRVRDSGIEVDEALLQTLEEYSSEYYALVLQEESNHVKSIDF